MSMEIKKVAVLGTGVMGSQIAAHLTNVMKQNDVELGLATMCIGTGQGIATILERIN